jgi:predicted AlkP superfamily pyrophosphatase or phosphodiesterase
MSLKSIAIASVLAAQAAALPLAEAAEPPKLVVAILVDQLRYDYLERFHDQFPAGGFRLLTDEGAFMTFARYNYVPTITAPGHASVFSGAPPAMHGIIANDWFDKRAKKTVYCCGDSTVNGVGTTKAAGKMSPRNFIGANFADQLRLHYRSKVVGISMKDRGAILPAGKKPTGAYWFEGATGNFVTSTYYMNALPAWVTAFNDKKIAASFLGKQWERLLPEDQYERPDTLPGEGNLSGEKTPTFPHTVVRPDKVPAKVVADDEPSDPATGTATSGAATTATPKAPALEATPGAKPTGTSSLVKPGEKPAAATAVTPAKESYDNILPTPYSNQLLAEFARAAIEGEKLGEGKGPDLLTVSFSAVDACGHKFGPYSQEVQDITLRLDRELAGLFSYLDKKFGMQNVVLTLTADHGVAPTPEFAAQENFGGQRVDEAALVGDLSSKLSEQFGTANVLLQRRIFDGHVYFNHDALKASKIAPNDVVNFIREWAVNTGKYQAVYSREQILDGRATGLIGERVFNGFNAERSGDAVLIYKPFTLNWGGKTGTTHGSPYSYDTHVPVLFYGTPFKAGRYPDEFYITDFVPTLCAALHMTAPPTAIGKPLVKVLAAP